MSDENLSLSTGAGSKTGGVRVVNKIGENTFETVVDPSIAVSKANLFSIKQIWCFIAIYIFTEAFGKAIGSKIVESFISWWIK